MVMAYSEVLLRHELAESHEALPRWKELLARAGDRKIEHYLRAVNDLVADTSDIGPLHRIVQTHDRGALGLSIGLMDGYRRLLYPGIREAYKRFLRDGNWKIVEDARMRDMPVSPRSGNGSSDFPPGAIRIPSTADCEP